MFRGVRRFLREWKETRRFVALPEECRRIVFYSEGPGYWTHLGAIVECLIKQHGRQVTYLTSREDDPILSSAPDLVTAFYIGDQSVRTMLFRTMDVRVLVTTMPDLETFHIKRSLHPVHYVYVHHSIVSSHMIYRPGAFDHFDTIFCVGPHHIEETRANEKLYGLSEKMLVKHGYGRVDQIIADANASAVRDGSHDHKARHVLVAPSWGSEGLLETGAQELVGALLEAGFDVTVRPHPWTRRQRPDVLESLSSCFGNCSTFSLDENMDSWGSLLSADVMISDWSGAALEFAFGLEKPVVFVDVPRKVNNPEYERLKIEPLEVGIRMRIGEVVPRNQPGVVVDAVRKLIDHREEYRSRIISAREESIFNVGSSASHGAEYIVNLVDDLTRTLDGQG